MSSIGTSQQTRQVIPRWHIYSIARWLDITKSIKIPLKNKKDEYFLEKIRSWQKSKQLIHACDLVGNALALSHFEDVNTKKAAKQIIKNSRKVPLLALEAAKYFLSPDTSSFNTQIFNNLNNDKLYKIIASIKRKVRTYPRNPILWMDLAFFYVVIGQNDPAKNCVTIALSLNNENRYLLRSSSRFFLHIGDFDSALKYLRKDDIGKYDPWLVAAELAISDVTNKSPKFVKSARQFIDNESIDPFHISEVASALGTIEYNSAGTKIGKKFFKRSLVDPTENSLAQVMFLKKHIRNIEEMIPDTYIHQSFESEARSFFEKGEYKKSVIEVEKWLNYQPFSSNPAVFGSYVASVILSDFKKAIKIVETGKRSSPNDFLLNNNHTFSLISLGKIKEAENILYTIKSELLEDWQQNTLKATKAAISFRKKDFETGRQLYKEAITFFKEKDLHQAEAIATLCWSREEKLAKSKKTHQELKEKTMNLANKYKLNELIFAAKKMK